MMITPTDAVTKRPYESLNEQTPTKRAGVNVPFNNWEDIVKAEKLKIEPASWADKPPKFLSIPMPSNVRREIGMGKKMPKGLR